MHHLSTKSSKKEIYRRSAQIGSCIDDSVRTRKKSIKEYINKITSNGIMPQKNVWKAMRPFLTNKGLNSGNKISLFEGGKTSE